MDSPIISPHFSFAELTTTAIRNVDNDPGPQQVENLRFLAVHLLEPLRDVFGPWHVTSAFRSPAVNRIVGGISTSQHVNGLAVDGFPVRLVAWSSVVAYLQQRKDLPVDQCIYEFGRWLHIGTRQNGHACRRQFLMTFGAGKYEPWDPRDARVKR